MAAKKVGVLVKEARTAAGFTQEKLAKTAGEKLTAADISKCERGEADLTSAQLKKIAIACGVTQASLVNAPKNLKTVEKKETAKTPAKAAPKASAKTTSKATASDKDKAPAKTSGKTASKGSLSGTSTGSKNNSSKKATVPANANTTMKVTASEKKLIETYRDASSDMKKVAMKVLKGEYGETINTLLSAGSGSGSSAADGIGEMLGGLLGNLLGGGK